jgi:hypothetical protein
MASNRRAAGQTSHHLARVIARARGDYFVSPRSVALARCALATCSSSGARQRPRSPEPAAPGSRRLMIGHARESRRPTKATLDLCATATMERNSASPARPARAVRRARECGVGAPPHDAKGAVRCGRRRRSRPGDCESGDRERQRSEAGSERPPMHMQDAGTGPAGGAAAPRPLHASRRRGRRRSPTGETRSILDSPSVKIEPWRA